MLKSQTTHILTILVTVICFFSIIPKTHGKTFSGRVIDADTREPIEGVVVVVYWHEARRTSIGDLSSRPKDVKETLTDKNGEWSVTGPAGGENTISSYLSLITGMYYTREPEFIIFKPGYCCWPEGFAIDACSEKLNPEGNGKIREGNIIELLKLRREKDRVRNIPGIAGGENALEKQKEFIRLINEERRKLGLPEIYGTRSD
jgi:hypothetical protein